MKIRSSIFSFALALSFTVASGQTPMTQRTPAAASAPTAIPALVPYSGMAIAADGKPLAGEASLTFLIYKEETGGEALWTETQAAAVDSLGHYKIQLGATNPNGLPSDLFANGEARWLEIQIAGEPAQARILLASVPYALKAGDATTLGGLPVSAFALSGSRAAASGASAAPAAITPDAGTNVTTTGGTSGYLPVFTGTSSIADSILFATSTGVGVGDVPNSSAVFDVNGKSIWRGLLNVARAGTATTKTGYDSFPMFFQASAYNTSSKAALFPAFQLQAEPTGNNTATTGGTFNLLYNSNSSTPTETGLYFNANGTIHFASGQTFPGTGAGTITGVTAGTGLSGGGTSGKVTLNVNTGVIPTLAANNSFTGADTFVASLYEDADVNIDNKNANSGGISPGLRLGSASGEGMASKRTSGGNQYGVDIFTDYAARLSINAAGQVSIGTGSTFNGAQLDVVSASGDGGDFTGGNDRAGVNATGGSGSFGGYGGEFSGGNSSGGNGGGGIFTVGGDGGGGGYETGDGIYAEGGFSVNSEGGTGGIFLGGGSENTLAGSGLIAEPGYSSTDGSGTYAADLVGNVDVNGTLTADAKNFKIDHPLDPANKYLNHASIESSEMVNIYSGNVTTNELGFAVVQLPDWFEAVNGDFRYQLTILGRQAHAWVAEKIDNHQFKIATNATNVEVSWQVTGVRRDAYAQAHPLVVEQTKNARERGFYKHPELYGQPRNKQTDWARHPDLMRRMQAVQDAHKAAGKVPALSPIKGQPKSPTAR